MEQSTKPPYLSYVTFRNTNDLMRTDGVPPILDSSVLKNMSGQVQSQLKIALRFLKLIDENDKTLPAYTQLVYASDEERKPMLNELATGSYDFMFNDPNFDIMVATERQFNDKFKDTGLSGDTLRKAETFFIHMAIDAGIPISRYIMNGRAKGPKSTSPSKPRSQRTVRKAKEENPVQGTPQTNQNAKEELSARTKVLFAHLEKFPEYNPEWDEGSRLKWLDDYNYILKMLNDDISENEKEVE